MSEGWTFNEVRRGTVEIMENDIVVGRVGTLGEARRFVAHANAVPLNVTGVYRLMMWKSGE